MQRPVSLLFGVHAHQPIGNFPEVLEDAHFRCYRPFLETLYRYPDFHFAVHFSGWLLDYLFEHYPQDMALLKTMVDRGQVELFGAGDTEPVLAVIPYRDRIGQIEAFSSKLAATLGQRPQGAWLTERVWESTVVPALANCGIRYVIVDDYHFLCTGKSTAQLNGFYTTEEDAYQLDIFPISETLRYKLPFSPANDAIAYLESLSDQHLNNDEAQHDVAIYFDDIEKFGIWPETYQWVYEKGWLEQFIQRVLASPRIKTRHYRDYHAAEKTQGVVYLPTTSYIEMNTWTLPAESAQAFDDLIKESKTAGWYEQKKAYLRGGIWKNFLSRYPESNWMHKRMLVLSARLAGLPENQRTAAMQQKLYAAQANDAYWHGLFGGLYLPHLRRAIYNHLIELEAMLDRCAPRETVTIRDFDLDGLEEIHLQNNMLQIIMKRGRYASIVEFDAYPLSHNFGDTLQRQTEHYYRNVQLDGEVSHKDGDNSESGIISAHDRVLNKHIIHTADLEPDSHPRHLFVDSLNDVLVSYQYTASDSSTIYFQSDGNRQQSIEKTLSLTDNRLCVRYSFIEKSDGVFRTEINLAMPSCDGVGGRFIYQDNILGNFGQLQQLAQLNRITLDDDTLGGCLILSTSVPVRFNAQPHFTVSQSEHGFEKIMQAVTLHLEWPVQRQAFTLTLEVQKHGRSH
ncbi:4-alpha-glucanotransferase/alpha-amylase [Nitrosomonas sp. Nm51]|uniref:alpha-amylase/4-alpha-glucanotransferase domain-containing protein n=1 Tax=Nitrosomonas sp. Nm51 TaxID=133720 RepID=UPI0008B29805|nr:alpha-amylase/4-alpha-glucanotransferase domain-containing protein [Nitrosomonas sp. Nm51]SER03959.1 4-alpha-glucanotransferase/alpha-amylase [Nitrosomonas sp. Nm51]